MILCQNLVNFMLFNAKKHLNFILFYAKWKFSTRNIPIFQRIPTYTWEGDFKYWYMDEPFDRVLFLNHWQRIIWDIFGVVTSFDSFLSKIGYIFQSPATSGLFQTSTCWTLLNRRNSKRLSIWIRLKKLRLTFECVEPKQISGHFLEKICYFQGKIKEMWTCLKMQRSLTKCLFLGTPKEPTKDHFLLGSPTKDPYFEP